MKRNIFLALLTLLSAFTAFSQSAPDATPMVIESQMILPKTGMEDKFEAAVLAHNKKFHPEGAYVAALRKIDYGPKAGWYVWVMGPTVCGSLDTRPTKESGHDQDWSTTIEPLVAQYGGTTLSTYNTNLSYGLDLFKKSKHYEIWMVDLKPGQYYRFKALCEKLKKVYEQMGTTSFVVLENALHAPGGPDVAIIWSFNTYSEWYSDNGPKKDYEKIYGEDSWQTLMEEWKDMIVDYTSELRSNIF
ncbi:MAG: hypothetical protein NTU98_14425 [Bacteroidetes bacterium]|nr:hypothetical protein [Bacteroidota bacterium]